MFDNIKRLKKLNKEIENTDTGTENSNEISVTLAETAAALSPFCDVDSPLISSDLSDYLDNKAEQLPLDKDICIKINGEADKQVVQAAIKNYYGNRLTSYKHEFKKNGVLSAVFTAIAIIALTAAVLIGFLWETSEVLCEIIDIIGWVFMWEAVDMYVLERGTLRIKQIRCLNFIRASYS